MTKKKVGIVGASGFTGSELTRLLSKHPEVEISFITSETSAGKQISDIHPFLEGINDQKLVSADQIDQFDPDLVFLALPHGVAMGFVKNNFRKKFRIIDLSGDFRLKDAGEYKEWYKMEHLYPEAIHKAVFGSPELYPAEIGKAKLVANPGCYPTSAILGLAPLLSENLIETQRIIVDAKSGLTGAGIKPKAGTHFSAVNENFKAYGLTNHRHTIEIQGIADRIAGKETLIQFTPHLLPVDRGILSTIYARPHKKADQNFLENLYREFYSKAPFVRIRKHEPAIKEVRGTNYCNLFIKYDERTGMIIVISVIDNLIKGAAGQAIQNMNLMFGLPEESGLELIPLHP